MLFNSFHYLLFFIAVSISYFLLPQKRRWILLLAASYIFYMAWRPELIVLIMFSTAVNYFLSLLIYRSKRENKRKSYLVASIVINFGLLFIFKYLVFFNHSFMALFGRLGLSYPIRDFDIILPMGISFYTFQAASYTIDVYRKKIKPVRHYGIFSLYITFFPQLVAGPIERSENLLPQFFKRHRFDLERAVMGVKIMLVGYFKKVVIADRVATAVNTVYNSPESFGGLYFIVATVLFTFQIYCDFSGYSDIALGSAKVLGFDLMKNFENPYLSKSIKEFWRRWHVSLSSWFMDYVYIPLGGSRVTKGRHYRNLMVTFLVSGLWHGSNWTFVLWGGLHGVYQVIGLMTVRARDRWKEMLHLKNTRLMGIISTCITFLLVCFAWIFFRANTAGDAFYIIRHLFDGFAAFGDKQYIYEMMTGMGLNLYELRTVVLAILTLVLAELLSRKEQVYDYFERRNILFRFLFYLVISTFILAAGVYYNAGEFIYFQF